MTQNTWQYQGRQQHGEWGHGTAPHADRPTTDQFHGLASTQAADLQLVADQGEFHRQVHNYMEKWLRSRGAIVQSHVGIQGYAPDPTTGIPLLAAIDMIVMYPGRYPFGIEIKTGVRPSFTRAQRVAYPQLMVGHAFSPDRKITSFGFKIYQRLPPIDIIQCYQKNAYVDPICEPIDVENLLE